MNHNIIHSNYPAELIEANLMLANESDLTIVECETAGQKWFELGTLAHRKAGFLAIPYFQTVFTSTIEMKEPKP